MPSVSHLFRLINEIVLFLLGALLMLLALTRRLGPPRSPVVWILLGVLLLYWGARAGMRTVGPTGNWHEWLRAGSFAVAGLAILNVAWLPVQDAPLGLGIAGAVMAVRGIVSAAAFARASLTAK